MDRFWVAQPGGSLEYEYVYGDLPPEAVTEIAAAVPFGTGVPVTESISREPAAWTVKDEFPKKWLPRLSMAELEIAYLPTAEGTQRKSEAFTDEQPGGNPE
jgi:hypothetical protein